jgi:hypothetical protein
MRIPDIETARVRSPSDEAIPSDASVRAGQCSPAADGPPERETTGQKSQFLIKSSVLAFVGMLCAMVLGFVSEMRPLDADSAERGYDQSIGSQTVSTKGGDGAFGATATVVCANAEFASYDPFGTGGRANSDAAGPRGGWRPGGSLSIRSMTGDAP